MAYQEAAHDAPEPRFEDHARIALGSVRAAIAGVLGSLRANPDNPQGVARRVGLDKSLAWKVSKIVQTDDPQNTLQHLPGLGGLQIFLRAARTAGASQESIAAFEDAISSFEEMMTLHAGDRSTLEIMIASFAPEGSRARDEAHRRSLYHGASYLLGFEARHWVAAVIVAPGSMERSVRTIGLSGLLGLRRLRTDTPGVVELAPPDLFVGGRLVARDPSANVRTCPVGARLAPRIESRSGALEVVAGEVGSTAAFDVACRDDREFVRTASFARRVHVSAPVQSLCFDLLVHRDLCTDEIPTVECTFDGPNEERRLPCNEVVRDLGTPADVSLTEAGEYPALVEAVVVELSASLEEFQAFRLEVKYPALRTAYSLVASLS